MPLQFDCTGCQRPLSVADDYEGSRVKCPQCGVVLPVPRAAETIAASPGPPRWRVRIPEGKVYGPIEQDELDRWIDEGRIDGDCMLQAEGEGMWKRASMIHRKLDVPPRVRSMVGGSAVVDPPRRGASSAYIAPHRGGMLLAFGIIGLVACAVFSPIAWWMSRNDMKAIREGRMDRRGEGLTQAGLILGIVGTALFAFSLCIVLVYLGVILIMISQGPGGF